MTSKEIDIFSISEASSSSKEPTGDCGLLFEVATPGIFRNNAFRITGLNIDATPREISKKASELKMMAELGDVAGVDANCFALNPTEDQIKTAIERLKDPQKRIIDEFFWFWPITEKSSDDDALSLIKAGKHDDALNLWWDARRKQETRATYLSAKHNIAVMMHMIALDWETGFHLKDELSEKHIGTLKDYWKDAFKIWESLVPNDELWSLVKKRVAQIDDPRLTTGFIRGFRNSLPEAFDKINGELAVKLARIGKQEAAKWHVDFMRETNQGLDDVDKTSELVLTPAREEIKHLISTACVAGEKSPEKSDAAAIELLDKSRPLLSLFDMFFSEGGYSKNDIFDEVAQAYLNLLIQYANLTGKHERASELLKNILPLAKSIDLREKIEASINIGKSNAEFELVKPIYEKLKSIDESLTQEGWEKQIGWTKPSSSGLSGSLKPGMKINLSSPHPPTPEECYLKLVSTVIPSLESLPLTILESETLVDLKNSIAIVLSKIAVNSTSGEEKDYQTAINATELAISIAVEPVLLKNLNKVIDILKDSCERSKCMYCKKDYTTYDKLKFLVKMYKFNTDSFYNKSNSIKYQTVEVEVPRCQECYDEYWRLLTKTMFFSVVVGAIYGAFISPWAISIASGLLVLIIVTYLLIKIDDILVGILYVFSLSGVYIGDTDFGKLLIVNSIGGAIVAGFFAFIVVKILKNPNKMALEHPNVKKMLSDGWSIGDNPMRSDWMNFLISLFKI